MKEEKLPMVDQLLSNLYVVHEMLLKETEGHKLSFFFLIIWTGHENNSFYLFIYFWLC